MVREWATEEKYSLNALEIRKGKGRSVFVVNLYLFYRAFAISIEEMIKLIPKLSRVVDILGQACSS